MTSAVTSERCVLWECLRSMPAYVQVTGLLVAEDWFLPAHGDLWQIMGQLYAEHGAFDAVAVSQQLKANASGHKALLKVLDAVLAGSIAYHCEQIMAATAARTLLATATKAMQMTNEGLDPIEVAERTILALRQVQRRGADRHTEIDYLDILQRSVDPGAFVVPGLIGRSERLVLTAPEGYGKSSLLRQIGGCTAAGLHPFNVKARIRPIRVLVIDAENPIDINTVEYQKLGRQLDALEHQPNRGMLTVEESGPMNLLDSRQAARLSTQVERLNPELIIIGPLYQLHEDNPNDEGPARKLSAVLDRLRSLVGASLITEAHTPHSDGPQGQLLRPYGASLWKRWPDFGYCLHPAVRLKDPNKPTLEEQASISIRESKFSPWRGQRAARAWPSVLRQGTQMLWEVQRP